MKKNKFNCFKCHSRCKAQCCGPVPITPTTWEQNQSQVQRTVIDVIEIEETGDIVPLTEDGTCVFLKKDYMCAIYEVRPDVCKKFGNESHPLLVCPYQDKNGNMR